MIKLIRIRNRGVWEPNFPEKITGVVVEEGNTRSTVSFLISSRVKAAILIGLIVLQRDMKTEEQRGVCGFCCSREEPLEGLFSRENNKIPGKISVWEVRK